LPQKKVQSLIQKWQPLQNIKTDKILLIKQFIKTTKSTHVKYTKKNKVTTLTITLKHIRDAPKILRTNIDNPRKKEDTDKTRDEKHVTPYQKFKISHGKNIWKDPPKSIKKINLTILIPFIQKVKNNYRINLTDNHITRTKKVKT